jgi:error-prone DNA polymerase
LLVQGRLQKHESIIHVVVDHMKDWTGHLLHLAEGDAAGSPLTPAGQAAGPERLRPSPARHPRHVRIMPKSRDFH